MRWHYRDPALLWLFVPAYGIHILEEWLAGFPAWAAQIAGRPLPGAAFVVTNAIAMLLAIVAIRAATRDERWGWLAVAIATVFLVNTVAHGAGAMLTGRYAPGLTSAVVFYVPLGLLTILRALTQAARSQVARGVVAGLAIHALVFVVAFAATRF